MLGLFSRRPRNVRPPGRTRLRLEPLEARANPAAPGLTGLGADWQGDNVVVVSGRIQDESPANAHLDVAGATVGEFQVDESGEFFLILKMDGPGSVYLRAVDDGQLASGCMVVARGEDIVPVAGQPTISDLDIYQDADGWHIRGRLNGCDPVGGIIQIIKGPGDASGQTGDVNEDGTFDIIIDMDPNAVGGGLSLIGIAGDGTETDPWDGVVG